MIQDHGNYYTTTNIVQVVQYYISDRKPISNTSDKENEKSSYGQLCYNLASPKLFHLVVVSYSEMLPIVRGDPSKSQSYKILFYLLIVQTFTSLKKGLQIALKKK